MRVSLFLLFVLMTNIVLAQLGSNDFLRDSAFEAQRTAPLGKTFPKFTAKMEGHTVSNELLKNKIVLLNFWFEGCHPCMAEMKALNDLHDTLKTNKDFLFISFTWDNSETIKRVKEKYGINFDVLSTNDMECQRLNFGNGYPTSIILDRQGTIKYLHNGGSTDEKKAREFIMGTLLSEIKKEL